MQENSPFGTPPPSNSVDDLADLFNMEVSEEEKPKRRLAAWVFAAVALLIGLVAFFSLRSSDDSGAFGMDGEYGSLEEPTVDVVRPTLPLDSASAPVQGSSTSTVVETSSSVPETSTTVTEETSSSVPETTVLGPASSTTTVPPTTPTTTTTTTTTTIPPTTTTAPPSAPSPPSVSSVTPSEQADSTPTVRFTWSSMSSVTDLEYNRYNGSSWSGWTDVSTSTTNSGYLSASFNTDQRYQIRARNCNSGGCSNWSYSNEASESVGGPTAAASNPSKPSIGGDATYNATYAYDFTWTNVGADEQECATNSSYNNWSDCSNFSRSGNSSANGTVYHRTRVRNVNAANVYGGGGASDWVYTNTRSYSFGAPAPVASAPSKPSIGGDATYNSTYAYNFTWSNVSASEQECATNSSYNNWSDCSNFSRSGNSSANGTVYHRTRVRNYTAPNDYGGGGYSDWVYTNTRSYSFGAPASTPSRPSAFTVSGSAGDLSASFSWSVANTGGIECSTSGGSSWGSCPSSTSYTVSSPSYSTTYTLMVRARNYTAPNDYGGGGYSSWRESNNASVTTPAPPGPTVTGWSRWTTNENTELGTIPRYHVSVSFTGTVNIQFFYNSNCSGSSSTLRLDKSGSDGASSTTVSGWVYNVYNGGSALLTDTTTGSSTCSNTSW